MKKKFIYFLCNKGLYKIAFKISPRLAREWKRKQNFKRLERSLNECTCYIKELQAAFKKFDAQINIQINGGKK